MRMGLPANKSEAMLISYNHGSNIAIPISFLNSKKAQIVDFNGDDNMYIPTTGNDTAVPPNAMDRTNLMRRRICETGVEYQTRRWRGFWAVTLYRRTRAVSRRM